MKNKSNKFKVIVSLIALFLFINCFKTAAQTQNKKMIDVSEKIKKHSLELRGSGIKKFLIFDIFIASFYLPKDIPSKNALIDNPKMIKLEYKAPVPKSRIAKGTLGGMEKNTSPEEFLKMKDRIEELKTFFESVEPGDTFINIYVPGEGTQFILNDKLLGMIPGPDFGKATFTVWLGDYPVDKKLKKQLLGK